MFELTEPQRMMQDMVRHWCDHVLRPALPDLESGARLPYDLMRDLAQQFGLAEVARASLRKRITALRAGDGATAGGGLGDMLADGDMGGDPMLFAILGKELCRCSPGFASSWGVSLALAGGAIIGKGTADQIERFALPLATLEKIGSWCLTEPGAGSDAFGAMATTARPDGDDYVLNGQKTFITNGPFADIYVVYAKLDRGQPREAMAVNTFILERGMPGFAQGKPFKKMGMRDSPTGELFFDNVRVPKANLLGGREKTAEGRAATKESLGNERSGLPAMAWGIIEECYERSLAYVRQRRQFGRPIGEFQAVQLDLADMYVKLKNVEAIVFRTAWLQQRGVRDVAFVNASKAYCSQMAVDVALKAIQLHGGNGYMEEYHIEKLARDAKLLELGAGTTHINYLTAARALLAG
ncbi:MAG: acyl-CoA dehydrogenase family protein [Deltaproteobacteria bacterium]|nr:acyl-CoA dehydrogenase family protein [Deltaproteobacteria bacterium]